MSAEGHKQASLKEAEGRYADQVDTAFLNASDVDAMGNLDSKPIGRFPYWDVAESVIETKAVGHQGGLHLTSHPHDEDEDDELTGRVVRELYERWKEKMGDPPTRIKPRKKLELVQKPSEAPDPDLELRQVDPITGENADYKVVINIGITIKVKSNYGDLSENTPDTDFNSKPETLTALEADVFAPLLTDQLVTDDQLFTAGINANVGSWVIPEQVPSI